MGIYLPSVNDHKILPAPQQYGFLHISQQWIGNSWRCPPLLLRKTVVSKVPMLNLGTQITSPHLLQCCALFLSAVLCSSAPVHTPITTSPLPPHSTPVLHYFSPVQPPFLFIFDCSLPTYMEPDGYLHQGLPFIQDVGSDAHHFPSQCKIPKANYFLTAVEF